jgi:hypothetical protein
MMSVADWAAVASAAGISLGTVFVLMQLKHMEMHRNVEISLKLFEWAENERLRKALRWIEDEFHFEDYDNYKAQEQVSHEIGEYAYEVTAFFEQVGFLVEKKFVDLDVVDDRLGSRIVSVWNKLDPWIKTVREQAGDKTFGEHFEKLYERTMKYMGERKQHQETKKQPL